MGARNVEELTAFCNGLVENFREYSATQFCNFYDEKVRTAPQNEKINVFTHKIKTDIEKYSKHIEQFCEDFKHYY